jgi:hypothetical protein
MGGEIMGYLFSKSEEKEMKKKFKQDEDYKIAEVDRVLNDLHIDKRLTKSDKLLYYENWLNQENKFVGKLEFTSILFSRWLNLLCNTDALYNLFMQQFNDHVNPLHSLLEFRKHLMNVQKRGQNVTAYDLEQLITYKNYSQFYKVIQELFLEYIPSGDIEKLIRLIEAGELTSVHLVVWHRERPLERLGKLLSFYK